MPRRLPTPFRPNGLPEEESVCPYPLCRTEPKCRIRWHYGYIPEKDKDNLPQADRPDALVPARWQKQGVSGNPALHDKDAFIEYHTAFCRSETTFLLSMKTRRGDAVRR